MIVVGIEGFGRHFVTWNLAALLQAPIYADHHAPYRSWNAAGVVPVFERWEDKKYPIVLVDTRDAVIPVDRWLWCVAPDVKEVTLAKERIETSGLNASLIINGSKQKSLFGDVLAAIPWEEQQTQAILMGMPLVTLVPPFAHHFQPIVEVIKKCT